MNIHEYGQGAVLREFGVPVPKGFAAFSVKDAVKAAKELKGSKGLRGEIPDPRRHGRGENKFQGPPVPTPRAGGARGQVHRRGLRSNADEMLGLGALR